MEKRQKNLRIAKVYFTSIRGFNHSLGSDLEEGERSYGDYVALDDFNVFIGENGSGKSTILDSISAISYEKIMASLPMYILKEYEKIKLYFKIKVNDKHYDIEYRFLPKDDTSRQYSLHISVKSETDTNAVSMELESKSNVDGKKIKNLLKSVLKVDFKVFNYLREILNIENDKRFHELIIRELNRASKVFHGVTNTHEVYKNSIFKVFLCGSEKSLRIRLESDTIPMLVQQEYLPSGWVSLAKITAFLCYVPRGSICIIDEPEVHLHPKLQRYLLKRIQSISVFRGLQVIIGTHSAVFMNYSEYLNSKLYQTRLNRIDEVKPSKSILNNLGYKLSDFLQVDGVIWVEGPSDKIYIKEWMKAYFAMSDQKDIDIDLMNFEFCFYGGSSLGHFGKDQELIDFLEINQNSAVIMDNDNEYNKQEDEFKCKNKERVFREYNKDGISCWVTHDYTIESYLSEGFLEKKFVFDKEKLMLVKVSGYSKVEIANKYVETNNSTEDLINNPKLNGFIKQLTTRVLAWCN